MANGSTRADRPHEVQYPTAADARGSSRINIGRRQYYLGPYDSPQSYVMFGLWKQRLLTSGEVPDTKDLRPLVDAFLSAEAPPPPTPRGHKSIPSLLIGAICLSLAIVTAAFIFSTSPTPSVDDQVLTANEIEFVRGIRKVQVVKAKASGEAGAKTARFLEQILGEGRIGHAIESDNQIRPISRDY
ncbi:MAG: hypothetical protein R3C53_23670 [Pirellulaceae bacterium]